MPPLERIMVGYREHDRRRLRLIDEYGLDSIAIRKCAADCGYPVYFKPSGVAALHERDAEVVCEECAELYYRELHDAL